MDSKIENMPRSDSEERYKTFIRLSTEGIYRLEFEESGINTTLSEQDQMKDFYEKGIIAECNDAMARMYGMTKSEELIGTRLKDVLVKSQRNNIESLKLFINSGYRVFDAESVEKDQQGNIKHFLNNLIGIVEDGKLIRVWGTHKDITDLQKATDALLKMNNELSGKNEELVKINDELDSFIYTVSHDLNSPLSNIEGLINVLKLNACYNEPDTKPLVDMMEVAIAKFKTTIKNIAEIPKSRRHPEKEAEEVLFEEVLENIQISIANLIADTGAEIVGHFNCQSVNLNRTSIHSVMYNLVNNALKYRHPDRKPIINVTTSQEDPYVTLEVKDNGLGFSPDKGFDVFDLFTRLHGHVEGTGLGLYIVKRLAENSGGKVEVTTTPGEGSCFKVYFGRS